MSESKSHAPSPDGPASTPLREFSRRSFHVPQEMATSNGNFVFRTLDGKAYIRDKTTGVIRRLKLKRGKHANA